jgi:hypothetical protein
MSLWAWMYSFSKRNNNMEYIAMSKITPQKIFSGKV